MAVIFKHASNVASLCMAKWEDEGFVPQSSVQLIGLTSADVGGTSGISGT